ncbi:MAG: tRNA lysidine(34) synthetase TilS [Gammaproteobacteria bacterium]|nr:tRNA lysidine(34) synthetase TilS [Gammaproteobacteria bacterium]
MAFHPTELLDVLPAPEADCLVAYSGGMDSHVLLHAMAELRNTGKFIGTLAAIHVNHGLNLGADNWAEHCAKVCKDLGIPLITVSVSVDRDGKGLEQAAREARHKAFADAMVQMDEGCRLLLAHHQDDQVETQIFRIMRGTGIRGLAGIHTSRAFANGSMVRPLLGYTRGVLKEYATAQGLDWVEDDSNRNEMLDRNFLRQRVLPELETRWPGYRKSLQRLAGLAEESQALLREVGEEDLLRVSDFPHRLSIAKLLVFSPARQRNIVRTWLLIMEANEAILAPDHYVVERIFAEIIPAAQDAEPVVTWSKAGQVMEIRRFADYVYAVLPLEIPQSRNRLLWETRTPFELPGLGSLFAVETADKGLVLPQSREVEIRFRQGGESVKPAGRKTRPLKKILQDYKVPPWWRDKIPLIYIDNALAAVGDLFIADEFLVKAGEAKEQKIHQIRWNRSYLHCGY